MRIRAAMVGGWVDGAKLAGDIVDVVALVVDVDVVGEKTAKKTMKKK